MRCTTKRSRRSPIGVAWYACIVSLVCVQLGGQFLTGHPARGWLKFPAHLLEVLVPLIITFAVLYRSGRQRERSNPARICRVLFCSIAIYLAGIAGIAVMLLLACILTLGFIVDWSPQ